MIVLKNIIHKNGINTCLGTSMGYKQRIYTSVEINIATDASLTNDEVCAKLGISIATLRRLRHSLKVTIGPGKGMKAGVPRPWLVKRETRVCAHPDCSNTFTVVPSKVRLYCCHRCHSLTLDNSYLQSPEVLKKRTKETTPAYKKYKALVHRLSGFIYSKNIDIINPNRYTRTVCGIKDGWQLDHIIPIKECYEKGMTPEEAASINNLRMLPWKDNLMRNYGNT